MTMPTEAPAVPEAAQVPPYDAGNPLLAGVQAQLSTGVVPTSDGNKLAVTVRTASTTLTVFLGRDEARGWAGVLLAGADQVGGLIAAQPGAVQAFTALNKI